MNQYKNIVMLLTNPYLPDPRPLREARLLKKNGFSVKIIAWDREEQYPEREVMEGIAVERIKIPCAYREGLKSIFKFKAFFKEVAIRLKHEKNVPIVFCHDFDTVWPALQYKKKHPETKIVLDSHEQYEGLFTRNNRVRDKLLYNTIIFLKKIWYKRIDFFIFENIPNKSMDEKIVKHEILNSAIIENFPEGELFKETKANANTDVINICYFGNVRDYELLSSIADSIEGTEDKYFSVAGMGKRAQSIEEYFESLQNSKYLGPFTIENIPALYNGMDVVDCLYKIDDSNKYSFPVKFFESFEVGIPAVTFEGTSLGEFIKEHRIGFVIEKESDVYVFFKSLLTADEIQKCKENIRKLQKTVSFAFESQEEKLIPPIENLIQQRID